MLSNSQTQYIPNLRAMPDPVLSETPPSIELTLTVLFCNNNYYKINLIYFSL